MLISAAAILLSSLLAYQAITADVELRQCEHIEARYIAFEEDAILVNEQPKVGIISPMFSALSFGEFGEAGKPMPDQKTVDEALEYYKKGPLWAQHFAVDRDLNRKMHVHLAVAYAMIKEDRLQVFREAERKKAAAVAELTQRVLEINKMAWDPPEKAETGVATEKLSALEAGVKAAARKTGMFYATAREELDKQIIEVRQLLSEELANCYNN